MNVRTTLSIFLLGAAGTACAQATDGAPPDQPGAYLSAVFGNGRMHGGNDEGTQWMRKRTFEVRAGREEPDLFGGGRIDFVHYNEGHPENNHRDGFAVQWLKVGNLGGRLEGELGLGPYVSMNTTTIDGRQRDDANWGLLLSGALRIPLDFMPDGTHLRVGLNHVRMPTVHNSTALMIGLGRQFGAAAPNPSTEPASERLWFGLSYGNSITNMSGTDGAYAGTLELRKYLSPDGPFKHWAASLKYIDEGDDGARVDRRGFAGQAWYVQQVTPRFAMSAGIGPYVTRNRRDDDRTRNNMLISFQAEHALSRHTRLFVNFNRVKTFRQTDDRDLWQAGVLKRF
ncbi:hypothetical protein [uncultured Massilia sp.]|uniref:hypothetical protein n=1 Tax=uncultured Massilia sp. TaxID=169973 RepID=UPI0025D0E9B2|nr:hypothetical protein [uncultured Massilia sp.]